MPLRRVDEERMAQIDGPRLTCCHGHRTVGTDFAEVYVRHTRLAGRFEEPGHVHMRADPDPRWSIILANIRKKKQHQQGAAARGHVYAPSGKIVLFFGIAVVTGKAAIDVPAGIAGIVRMRETWSIRMNPSRMNCSTCPSLSAPERKRSSSVMKFLSI